MTVFELDPSSIIHLPGSISFIHTHCVFCNRFVEAHDDICASEYSVLLLSSGSHTKDLLPYRRWKHRSESYIRIFSFVQKYRVEMTDTIVSEVDISMDCFFVYSIRTFSRLTCIYHYFIWSDYKNDKS